VFGQSVALDGGIALIGACGEDSCGTNAGAAYVFEREGLVWYETAKLTAADASTEARFSSRAVAIREDVALIGSSGAAYVFQRREGHWMQVARLTASDAGAAQAFGGWVSLACGVAFVSAVGSDSDRGEDTGAVYVFECPSGGWADGQESFKLTASDAAEGDQFGLAAVEGNLAVVTAWAADEAAEDAGAVYVFERTASSWSEVAKVLASDATRGDGLGLPSLDGGLALISTRDDDVHGFQSGSAYVLRVQPAGQAQIGAGRAGTLGVPALSASSDPLIGSSYELIAGNSAGSPTAGLLLVGAGEYRKETDREQELLLVSPVLQVMVPVPAAGLSLPQTLTPAGGWSHGSSIHLQLLQLDPGAPSGWSSTPGLRLDFGLY
jgi:hypothetical protein